MFTWWNLLLFSETLKDLKEASIISILSKKHIRIHYFEKSQQGCQKELLWERFEDTLNWLSQVFKNGTFGCRGLTLSLCLSLLPLHTRTPCMHAHWTHSTGSGKEKSIQLCWGSGSEKRCRQTLPGLWSLIPSSDQSGRKATETADSLLS